MGDWTSGAVSPTLCPQGFPCSVSRGRPMFWNVGLQVEGSHGTTGVLSMKTVLPPEEVLSSSQ